MPKQCIKQQWDVNCQTGDEEYFDAGLNDPYSSKKSLVRGKWSNWDQNSNCASCFEPLFTQQHIGIQATWWWVVLPFFWVLQFLFIYIYLILHNKRPVGFYKLHQFNLSALYNDNIHMIHIQHYAIQNTNKNETKNKQYKMHKITTLLQKLFLIVLALYCLVIPNFWPCRCGWFLKINIISLFTRSPALNQTENKHCLRTKPFAIKFSLLSLQQ